MYVHLLVYVRTGTGKTLLAKAAATETGATFIELKISDIVRGEIGESEKVRRLARSVQRTLVMEWVGEGGGISRFLRRGASPSSQGGILPHPLLGHP